MTSKPWSFANDLARLRTSSSFRLLHSNPYTRHGTTRNLGVDANAGMADFRLRYSPEINDPVGWRNSSPLHIINPPVSPFSTIDEALAKGSGHPRHERRLRSLLSSEPHSGTPRTPRSPTSPSSVRKRSCTTVGASGGRFYASELGHHHRRERDDGDLASMMKAMSVQPKPARSKTVAVPQYIECTTYNFPSPGPSGSESKVIPARPTTMRAATYAGHTSELHISSGAATSPSPKKISFYGTGSGHRSGPGLSIGAVLSDNFYVEGASEKVFAGMTQQDIWLQLAVSKPQSTARE